MELGNSYYYSVLDQARWSYLAALFASIAGLLFFAGSWWVSAGGDWRLKFLLPWEDERTA
jgi:hypothetical protein